MQHPKIVTAAIDYTNGAPHLGHFYEKVIADTIVRYERLAGGDTELLLGTDEHGDKIYRTATAAGKAPREFVDELALPMFRDLWTESGFDFAHFTRTTDPDHVAFVQQMLQRAYDNGDIYLDEYEGLYSVGSERFVTESELVMGEDGLRRLPGDKDPPVQLREKNYFFKLQKHKAAWLAELEAHPEKIVPLSQRQATINAIRDFAGDLSISRPASRLPWGIELPWDKEHVAYVWFDALLVYLGAPVRAGHSENVIGETWHVIGKDINKPHSIFWPTMLKSFGLPSYGKLFIHGHVTDTAGNKMGKSLGNAISPREMVENYPIDSLRYALLTNSTLDADNNFGAGVVVRLHNNELANDLGNLLARVQGMLQKYTGGVIPAPAEGEAAEAELQKMALSLPEKTLAHVRLGEFKKAIDEAMELVRALNRYVAASAPWTLAKAAAAGDEASEARLHTVLYTACEGLRVASVALEAVMPNKAPEIRRQLGLGDASYTLQPAWGLLPSGIQVAGGEVLFPRLELTEEILAGEAAAAELKKELQQQKREARAEKENNMSTETQTTTIEATEAEQAAPQYIDFEDFAKIELRLAEVLACEAIENADKLLKFTLKVGDEERTILSGIRQWFSEPSELVGRRVVIVANLAPRKIRGIVSQGMILSAAANGDLDIVTVQKEIASGAGVS